VGVKRVAIVGAGPSGLVTAKELLQEGHAVTCFERTDSLGGVF
jgi:cation diffusion facilitator CzcD-associated flavoprotein CzcO